MATSVKSARAWVPASVATLLVILLLLGSGLLSEIIEDRDVAALRDPDSVLGVFVYGQLAPVGSPGIVGDHDFGDSIVRFGGGLVPVVILVFLFTWLSARAARAGSALTVLLGAWLGTVLGVGLGGLTSLQVFIWQDNLSDSFVGLQLARIDRIGTGLYWGAIAGLAVGLVALLIWLMARPRGDKQIADQPTPEAAPPDPSSYPPPGRHQQPAGTPPPAEETVRAPKPGQEP